MEGFLPCSNESAILTCLQINVTDIILHCLAVICGAKMCKESDVF